MRRMRIVETPEDLVSLYADAQTSVTFDPISGRFYYPSLGLYLDPTTSLFYDPNSGTYRDVALRGTYDSATVGEMYYDATTGLYHDGAKMMSYNPATGLYHDWESGLDLSYDSQIHAFFDPVAMKYYDRGLGAHLIYVHGTGMFHDETLGLDYEPERGLYFSRELGFYYDRRRGLYYDTESELYFDPVNWVATVDPHRRLRYDDATGYYFCVADGLIYSYDAATRLYCRIDNQVEWRQHYYDPMSGDHFIREGTDETSPYLEERYGNIFDPGSRCYFDRTSSTYYCYDSTMDCYVDAVSGTPFIPAQPVAPVSPIAPPAPPVLFEETGYPGVTYEIATGLYWCEYDGRCYISFDPELELFADDGMSMMGMGQVVYYEPKTGFHLVADSMSGLFIVHETNDTYDPVCGYFCDNLFWRSYRYDPEIKNFRDTMSGELYRPGWMDWVQWIPPGGASNPSSPDVCPIDVSNLTFDPMMDMYYDSSRGMYYDAAAVLYYDGMAYYDPTTWEGYWYDDMLEIYLNNLTGETYVPPAWSVVNLSVMVFDPMGDLYYDAGLDLYFDAELLLYYDYTNWYDPLTWEVYRRDVIGDFFVNVETGRQYIPLVHAEFRPLPDVPGDPLPDDPPPSAVVDTSSMVYDEEAGMYYDAGKCLYYDAVAGFYYDNMLDCYYEPGTWNCYAFDTSWQVYFCTETGKFYRPHSAESGYAEDISRMSYEEMTGMYWDPEREMYYVADADLYYSFSDYGYYDPVKWERYSYDGMWQRYVNDDTQVPYVPRPRKSDDVADTAKMFYDELIGLYYDPERGMYYDPGVQMYVEGRYFDTTGGQYYYDPEANVYRDVKTGEVRTTDVGTSASTGVVDLSTMVYDEMAGMYYDCEQGRYFDVAIGLYYDGMHYFNPVTGERCWYDWSRDAYVAESGEVYDPGQAGVRYKTGTVEELTSAELAEINAAFRLLAQLRAYGSENEGVGIYRVVRLDTYYAAPYSAADAVWFYELLGDSVKRVRLRPGVMPQTIEVETAEAWNTLDGGFMPTGIVIPVSREVWDRSVRIPEFTLEPTWDSMVGSLFLANYNPINYGSLIDDGMMMGEEVDAEDAAVIGQYAGDQRYGALFTQAVFRGYWSLAGNGEYGASPRAGTTIGGLQDSDGDGLSDIEEIRRGTNPLVADTDGDGMNDALEVLIGSDPNRFDFDSDYDGMPDVWEEYFGFNPFNPVDADGDPDHDGLRNFQECALGTNPRNADTDGDGLRDGEELKYGTQPCNPDTDNDQLPDGAEIARGTNPFNPDTDLDGLGDGVEVGLGLDPLSVDTDGDGIADGDEVKYGLVGMSMLEKDQLMVVQRLRNWQPIDVEDLESDDDRDGIPDWLEVLGGSSPFGDLDVFKGVDGFPAVFKLTITLAEPLAKPICLEVNGAKVCLQEARAVERWCKEGELYQLSVVGCQGTDAKISYTFEDARYQSKGIVDRGLDAICRRLPGSANHHESTRVEGEFYEPMVKMSPAPVCFHGEHAAPETNKTLRCEIMPKGKAVAMETVWWVTGHEQNSEHRFGPMVNIDRSHVGSTVFCKVLLSVDEGKDSYARQVQQRVYECHQHDTDAHQIDWCEVHGRESWICRAEGIPKCDSATMMDVTKVPFLPTGTRPSGGGGTGTSSSGAQPANDNGLPYFTGDHAATSVVYNSDDDNNSGRSDRLESWVANEDDLRMLFPIWPNHDPCCPCPEHAGEERILLGAPHGVGIWSVAEKFERMDNRRVPLSAKVHVEGREMSEDPEDAGFRCTLESDGQSSEPETLDRTFTVYSVRLVPDLNRDNLVDERDVRLVRTMEELGLGWNIDANRRIAFRLESEVMLKGQLRLSITQKGKGQSIVNVFSSEDSTQPLVQLWDTETVFLDIDSGEGHQTPRSFVFWVEASAPGAAAEIEAVFTGTGNAAGYDCHAKLRATANDFRIAGDGGVRDGKIDFDDPADTNVLFWVNDDYDVIRWNNESGEKDFQEDDEIKLCKVGENAIRNCDDDVIGMLAGVKNRNYDEIETNGVKEIRYCMRDLEDFDRLHLKVGGRLQDNKLFAYEFRFVPEGQSVCPEINIFEAMDEGDFYLRGIEGKVYTGSPQRIANQKNRDSATLEAQMEIRRNITIDRGWSSLTNLTIGGNNCFLYEGKKQGTGHLEVRVRYRDMILAETSLKMQLEEARAFTEVYQIRDTPLTNAAYTNEFMMAVADVEAKAASAQMPGYNDKELVLLVLGWNVEDSEKFAWNDMVFKRLFWHGYRGRVGSFIWPCQRGVISTADAIKDPPNFDRSEHRAWLSAEKAAEKFHELVQNGVHLTLIVHSQGNILAGEALRRMSVEDKANITYLAWQGAISAQMYTTKYDVTTPGYRGNMSPESWVSAMAFAGKTYEWLTSIFSANLIAPDLFGHYPDGKPTDPPYLYGALVGLRYSVNFYNRRDYALNIWLGNHATRPDNLRTLNERLLHFSDDLCFGYRTGTVWHQWENQAVVDVGKDGVGRFYQMRNGKPMVIYPGSRSDVNGDEDWLVQADQRGEAVDGGETTKWCVFSFVVKSRSLAIGQVNMDGVFRESIDLQDKYKFTERHYGHSYEFRSNLGDTWKLWEKIKEGINYKKQENQ